MLDDWLNARDLMLALHTMFPVWLSDLGRVASRPKPLSSIVVGDALCP